MKGQTLIARVRRSGLLGLRELTVALLDGIEFNCMLWSTP
jgi:hypothetical protein